MYLEDGKTPTPDAVFLPNAPRPKAKFEDEARGIFGVAMVKNEDGSMRGEKMRPYPYTGCNVVGGARFKQACLTRFAEIQQTDSWKAGSGYWKHKGGLAFGDNPYRNKYGDEWEHQLRKTMRSRKIVWVNDLVLHVYTEGERIYKDTSERKS